jgi:hypothetical protein
MTKPHRATPEQWEFIERFADSIDPYSCFLELRDRIEALEAAQHAHVDTSHLTDAERKQIREELARPATFAELLMPPPRTTTTAPLFTAEEVARIVAPTVKESLTDPAGSPVERVQAVCDDKPLGHEARAAILQVAAWLVEQAPEPGPVGKWLGQIATPFEVMADMLRDEANR